MRSARAQPDTSEYDRGNRVGPEREKSTKFISGHPRAEPRPGTNSIASVALFRERAHGTLTKSMVFLLGRMHRREVHALQPHGLLIGNRSPARTL
ncbi:hypothetical protein ALC57_17881 [Trachymyrmex cornetzi]|uniref:Uncharacterized protein n=1 Tax=Trachymyrmex cornetzi TaxID=471704 RepID=A0A151ISU7_9HYME|nr:hypothetical protein ALC57_17881 [Trachymyrmex cornetzi]